MISFNKNNSSQNLSFGTQIHKNEALVEFIERHSQKKEIEGLFGRLEAEGKEIISGASKLIEPVLSVELFPGKLLKPEIKGVPTRMEPDMIGVYYKAQDGSPGFAHKKFKEGESSPDGKFIGLNDLFFKPVEVFQALVDEAKEMAKLPNTALDKIKRFVDMEKDSVPVKTGLDVIV